jgi:hypothetical protein
VASLRAEIPGLLDEVDRLRAALEYCGTKARCLRIALDHPIDMAAASMQGSEIIQTVESALNPKEATDGQG